MRKIKFSAKIFAFTLFLFVFFVFTVFADNVFGIISSPKVIDYYPNKKIQRIYGNSSLIIKFDKPIKRKELRHFISPEVYGEWKFEDPLIKNHLFRKAIFIPAVNFKPDTKYRIKLENIKGFGFSKSGSFQFYFKTNSSPKLVSETKIKDKQKENVSSLKQKNPNSEITILEIPLDWQDDPLSCEAASLKMALVQKGVFLEEDDIMEEIGYDLTLRKEDIWGDPYKSFVGDIKGKMCQTGFGVFWNRVAESARKWSKESQDFSEWTISDLTGEIKSGNPVIVWGVLKDKPLTNCSWRTLEGKYIKAYKETHVRLVIGFVGPSENPSKIILNDPLSGRLFWLTSDFLKNWKSYNYSGVTVR